MRADAEKNRSQILSVARSLLAAPGPEPSMRDIARQAGVGLATLLRHFPSRDALFEGLVCTDLDALTRKGEELATAAGAQEALIPWLHDWVAFARSHRGVVALMAAAHDDPDSALYASCAAVHSASARLLVRAQAEGTARGDMTGDDLFALMTALGWAVDQPSFAPRADQLVRLITDAILAEPPTRRAE